jgi:hypothetical protein
MKRPLICLGFLLVFALGCSLFTGTASTATSEPEGVESPQPQAEEQADATKEPAAPKPDAQPAPSRPTNTTCHELAFFLDSKLADEAQCFLVPEAGGAGTEPSATNPEYTKTLLLGYRPSGRMMQPVISVFPVSGYRDLLPDIVDPAIALLQKLTSGSELRGDTIPIFPVQDASQLFVAQYRVIQFQSGTGVRYITQYGTANVPPNNHDLFYSFQGLTADGRYWVSVILPTTQPSLWDTAGNPTNSEYKTIDKDPEAYYAQKVELIDGFKPRTFLPSIELFDALVESILIQP